MRNEITQVSPDEMRIDNGSIGSGVNAVILALGISIALYFPIAMFESLSMLWRLLLCVVFFIGIIFSTLRNAMKFQVRLDKHLRRVEVDATYLFFIEKHFSDDFSQLGLKLQIKDRQEYPDYIVEMKVSGEKFELYYSDQEMAEEILEKIQSFTR